MKSILSAGKRWERLMARKKDILASKKRASFTGRTYELTLFKQTLKLLQLSSDENDHELQPKSLFSIRGMGGVGKTTLLSEFENICREEKIPVVLVNGALNDSVVSILMSIASQLQERHPPVKTSHIVKQLQWYREIHAKLVEDMSLPDEVFKLTAKGVVSKESELRLRHRIDELRQKWELLSQKLSKIEADKILETRTDERMRLEYLIDELQAERQQVEQRLNNLEMQLSSKTRNETGKTPDLNDKSPLVKDSGSTLGKTKVNAITQKNIETVTSKISHVLPKEEADFYLNPESILTQAMLEDINKHAKNSCLVIIFDAYETMQLLDGWIRNQFFANLEEKVLVVIAGRKLLSDEWEEWREFVQIIDLVPFNSEESQQYVTSRGINNPGTIQKVLDFADGIPLALSIAIDLIQEFGTTNFNLAIKEQDMVDRVIRQMIADVIEEMRTAFRACAIVRAFNQDILKYLLKQDDVNDIYRRIRSLSFVYPHPRGLTLHDKLREYLDTDFQHHEPDTYRSMHEAAAKYYNTLRKHSAGKEWQEFTLEYLYHKLRSKESEGIGFLIEILENANTLRQLEFSRTLVDYAEQYNIRQVVNRQWIEYGKAHLAFHSGDWDMTMRICTTLKNMSELPSLIKVKVRELLGMLGWRQGRWQEAVAHLEKALTLLTQSQLGETQETAWIHDRLSKVYILMCKWSDADTHLTKAEEVFKNTNNNRELAHILYSKGDLNRVQGFWTQAIQHYEKSLTEFQHGLRDKYWTALTMNRLAWVYYRQGKWEKSKKIGEHSLDLFRKIQTQFGIATALRGLSEVDLSQNHVELARQQISESLDIFKKIQANADIAINLGIIGNIYSFEGNYEKALANYEEALKAMCAARDHHSKGWVLINKGYAHLDMQECELALKAFLEAEQIFREQQSWYKTTQSLTGAARAQWLHGKMTACLQFAEQAECLARQYNYYEELAWINTIRGNLLLNKIPKQNSGFLNAIQFYKEALKNALNFNCFVLDEVLEDLLNNIGDILFRNGRGKESKEIVNALISFWQVTPDKGDSLGKKEQVNRNEEMPDWDFNKSVLERLKNFLNSETI